MRLALAGSDPGNAEWQLDLALGLVRLAGASDGKNAVAALSGALEIVTELERDGGLPGERADLRVLIETRLSEAQPLP